MRKLQIQHIRVKLSADVKAFKETMLEVGKNVRNIWAFDVGIIRLRTEKVSNARKARKRGKRKRKRNRIGEKRKGKTRTAEERETTIAA